MSNNQILASDNFASGSLAAGWAAVPGQSVCQVIAGPPNYTEPNTLLTLAGQIWTGLIWPNDHISEVNVTMTGSAVATTLLHLHVRNQGGGSYSGYRAIVKDSGAWEIDVVTAGTPTSLISGTGLTIAANDIWTFGTFGSLLVLYQNFKRIGYIGDATYTGGSPGYSQEATTTLSTNKVFSWRGYSAIQTDGVWTKQGVIMPATSAELALNPSGVAGISAVSFGPSRFLTSGNCWRGYYGAGNTVNYTESLDGETNWTRYSGNPVIPGADSIIFEYGGTSYAVVQTTQGSSTPVLYTATDGLTFSLQGTTNLPGAGYPCGIFDVVGGNFYLFLGKLNGTNSAPNGYLYTAPIATPLVWTVQNSGNPVLPGAFPNSVVSKVNGTYYIWTAQNQPGQGNATASGFDPLETVRWKSTANPLATWVQDTHSIHAWQMSDSLNNTNSGPAPNCVVDIGGKAHMFYQGSPGDSTGPQDYQPMLAIAPAPLASIVQFGEDASSPVASDAFPGSSLSAQWTNVTGVQAISVGGGVAKASTANGNACIAVRTGETYSPNQYSEFTITTLADFNSYLTAGVRALTTGKTLYQCQIRGGAGGTASLGIFRQINGVQKTLYPVSTSFTPSIGDVIRLTIVNGPDGFPVLTGTQNGFTIAQVQDQDSSALMTGNPALQINASTQANATTALWAGGNANVIPNYPPIVNSGAWVQAFRGFVNKRGVS